MKKKYLLTCIIVAILQGCAIYHKMPVDRLTVEKKLCPPAMNDVQALAKSIKHPILKPVVFNYNDGLSPDEAAILAVIANPNLRAIRDQKGIAKAQLLSAGILPNPQISYSLDVPTGGSTNGTINAGGLGLAWDISSLISRSASMDAARENTASVDLRVAWQEWQVAQAAKLHVFRLLFIKKQLDMAKETERYLRKNLKTVQKAFSLGVKTIIDRDAAKMAYLNAYDTVLTLLREQNRERLALNRSLGFPPAYEILLQKKIGLPLCKNVPEYQSVIKGIEDRRLDLLGLKKGYESRDARVRAAILSQFPGINIGVNHARDTGNVVTTGFAVTLDLPFFDRNQGQVAIERAGRKQLSDEYAARIFDARSQVATILADMNSTIKQMDSAEKSVNISTRLVKAYKNALSAGNADVISYNNLLADLETGRQNVLKLQMNFIELRIAMEIASGKYPGRDDAVEMEARHD
ncbi:MAG: TolC family protein [Deltaproteobacteria bacterium]|nr:TolC family protein [Deltaproteobacteria bacterium]